MFKYLLVVLVVWCEIQRCVFATQYISDRLFTIPNPENDNCSTITEELNKKSVIVNGGSNNYNVGQQVFYLYDEKQLKRILNHKNSEKLDNTGLTKHKLVTRKVIWNTARQTCKNEGGYLAIINSEEEEQLLLRLLKDNNINSAWLGVHDLYQEGEWITINGEALEETGYSKWTKVYQSEQPDNYGGDQNCALLIKEGGMDDENCNHVYSFFCEMAA